MPFTHTRCALLRDAGESLRVYLLAQRCTAHRSVCVNGSLIAGAHIAARQRYDLLRIDWTAANCVA